MGKQSTSPATQLDTTPWHWSSIIVYVAAIFCIIDIPFQYIILHDTWGVITSALLALFLSAESYGRLKRQQTYLGKSFAPILSVLIMVLTSAAYLLHFYK